VSIHWSVLSLNLPSYLWPGEAQGLSRGTSSCGVFLDRKGVGDSTRHDVLKSLRRGVVTPGALPLPDGSKYVVGDSILSWLETRSQHYETFRARCQLILG
jgi:hypothetical protein